MSKIFDGSGKIVHLFDTFSGMPPTTPDRDVLKKGVFSDTSVEDVRSFLKDCRNIRLFQGLFPATASQISNMSFCFVHIDVDIDNSVMDSCDFFYPRMVKGAVIAFDDYGCPECPGAKMAVDEFFRDKEEYPCYLPTGQCYVIKL